MQEIIFIFYARVFYTFSTVFNKVMNIVFIFAGKRIPNIRKMSELRKLKITEMNRLTVEEFKEVDKLPLVVVLDEVRSLHNIGAVFRTSDAFLVNCIYLLVVLRLRLLIRKCTKRPWERSIQWTGSISNVRKML